jgi:restriction system protein
MVNLMLVLLVAGILGYYILKYKKELLFERTRVTDLIQTNGEMKSTLLLGLYHRFKKSEEEKEENPWDFERFVAKIMSEIHESDAYVTAGSNDFGVDIEERRDDGLYLGQVKCYAPHNLVGFEPIAIIHSQMVKQGAKGGYIVTTSGYTENAIHYAQGLGIQLVTGPELIEYWVKVLDKKVTDVQQVELVIT